MTQSTVTVIDIGSNSIKSLVATQGHPLRLLHQGLRETRISAGISKAHPRLEDSAMLAAMDAVYSLLQEALQAHPGSSIAIVATSAVRDAMNGDAFAKQVQERTGQPLTILSGEDEARLIGLGLSTDPLLSHCRDFSHVDLGGGSLECIRYRDRKVVQAVSLRLGAVRLTEAELGEWAEPMPDDLPQRIGQCVDAAMKEHEFIFTEGNDFLAGTGGACNVARVLLEATGESQDGVLPCPAMYALYKRLAALPLSERKAIPGLPAQRADILPVALLTLLAVAKRAGADHLLHSLHNLRYGLALEMLSS